MLLPMKITTRGQVTIPKRLREKYGLYPNTDVVFEDTENAVIIRPAHHMEEQLRLRLEEAMGSATVPITTDEILTLTRGDG